MAGRRSGKRPNPYNPREYRGPNPYNPREYRGGLSSLEPEDQEPLNDVKRKPILNDAFSTKAQEFIAFDNRFARAMLSNLKVLMIGDSLMRGLYKDLITWTETNELSTDMELKEKAESSYRGDRQVDISLLSADKVFRQAREYQSDSLMLQFQFTTRVMKDDIESLIQQMLGEDGYPDLILINSMIWDLTRYFQVSTDTSYSDNRYQKRIEIEALQKYLDRTSMLLRRLRAILPPHTMVVWVCFPHCRPTKPTNGRARGMQNEPLALERNHFIRSVMIDGSFRISQVVRNAGYDVLDVGFYMRNHAFYHYQKNDGMHWLPAGVRLMSQLLLQFLAKSWGIDTSYFFSRLEDKQSSHALKEASAQIKKYTYYADAVPRLHNAIAKKAFKKLRVSQEDAVKDIVQHARALTPFVQPPRKFVLRRPMPLGAPPSGPNARPSESIERFRVAPHVERDVAHDVDDLGMQLNAKLSTIFRDQSRK